MLLEENTGASFSRHRLTRLRRARDSESPPAPSSSKRKAVVESSDDDLDNDDLELPAVQDIQNIWDDERNAGGRDDDDDMDDDMDNFIEYEDEDEEEEGAGIGGNVLAEGIPERGGGCLLLPLPPPPPLACEWIEGGEDRCMVGEILGG